MAAAVRVQLGAALTERAAAASPSPAHPAAPDAVVRRVMTRAARATLKHAAVRDAELSITLLDDSEIAEMNQRFLTHDGPTDVLSFALYDEGDDPVGDVYIGYDQAVRQAVANEVDVAEELARLAVHGTLHVLGHDHPSGPERLSSEMWQIQETIVARVLA